MTMKSLTMAAVNIDGVLLQDTFSPVLRLLINKLGIDYTPALERALFSRPQEMAAHYLISNYALTCSREELIGQFFSERKSYIKNNPGLLSDGADELLKVLRKADLSIVCYGGLGDSHFRTELHDYLGYFLAYICTNDFRPGVKEIIEDLYHVNSSRIVFIDDVNTVAEAAKQQRAPFIGVPSTRYQEQDMIRTGVKFMVPSIRSIDSDYINMVDEAALAGTHW